MKIRGRGKGEICEMARGRGVMGRDGGCTSCNRYCTTPHGGPWGYNFLSPPSAHTPRYNASTPKPYYSKRNPPSHKVVYSQSHPTTIKATQSYNQRARVRRTYGIPRGYRSPGLLGTIRGGRLYLLSGGGGTIVPFNPLK